VRSVRDDGIDGTMTRNRQFGGAQEGS